MKTYLSKSSTYVKIVTTSAIILLAFIPLTLINANKNYGLIGGIVLGTIILGAVIYFYAKSLDKIILEKEMIVLKKNVGQIKIPKLDIVDIHQLDYSNLTMTYGSQGVFGFIGSTMDDSTSFVKDRKNMVRIITKNKKYIVSSERPGELVKEIKARYQIEL